MLVAAPTEEIAMTVRIHDQIHEIDLHPKTPKQPHLYPIVHLAVQQYRRWCLITHDHIV